MWPIKQPSVLLCFTPSLALWVGRTGPGGCPSWNVWSRLQENPQDASVSPAAHQPVQPPTSISPRDVKSAPRTQVIPHSLFFQAGMEMYCSQGLFSKSQRLTFLGREDGGKQRAESPGPGPGPGPGPWQQSGLHSSVVRNREKLGKARSTERSLGTSSAVIFVV